MLQTVVTYRYRLLPTRAQHGALANILDAQRILYNAALEERLAAWRCKDPISGKGVSPPHIDQCAALTQCRAELPEMQALPVNVQRGTLRRVHRACESFFARVKKGGAKGFPRFKVRDRFQSFAFAEFRGIRFDQDARRLWFKGLPGSLRVHMHRAMPTGKILSAIFKRDAKGWHVSLAMNGHCAAQRYPKRCCVGVDVGLESFARLSDGLTIPAPRLARKAERAMRLAQRALARAKRGSQRRRKTKERLARLHAKIARARQTFLHQASARLIAEHDLIAVEDLSIRNMTASAAGTMEAPGTRVQQKSGLNRSILDAAWGKFLQFLDYKAAKAGVTFIRVDAKGTSQQCSGCGAIVAKTLADRMHRCTCGTVLHRDHNAALNILHRAVVDPAIGNVARSGER